jgi:hypothetical protein
MTAVAERNARRTRVRAARAVAERAAAADAARRQEAADEAISPAAQRNGTALRGPRVVRDGNTFRAWPVIAMLAANGAKREAKGLQPVATLAGIKAAIRLRTAWEMCRTVTHGVSSYQPRGSSAPETGVLSAAVSRSVNAQIDAAAEVDDARRAAGILWPILAATVAMGESVEAYADRRRMDRKVAMGELGAALKVLARHYATMDA